jgi:hypothetical protein
MEEAAPPRFLIEANLGHALVIAVRQAGWDAEHMATWEAGRYRQADDAAVLAAASSAGRVLITLDGATIPALAWAWVGADPPRRHAGVLVLSSRISQADLAGQPAAVRAAVARMAGRSWIDLVVHAHRGAR